MNLLEIIEKIGISREQVVGNLNTQVERAMALDGVSENSLTYCKKGCEKKICNVRNCIIIISNDTDISSLPACNTYIISDNPRLLFIKVTELFHPFDFKMNIDARSFIHPSAQIDPEVYIGPFAYIGQNCKINKNAIIYPHVILLQNITVCEDVMITAGTVIGGDGFGFERNEDKSLRKFPHAGGVFISKKVEIGSNTSIDRGVFSDTMIGEGTKIDNLVHIAHNVKIGKHCEIIANSMIGGSVVIGDNTRIAPGAQIMNGISIGKNVLVGLGAVVTKDIQDNAVVAGVPARNIDEFRKYLQFIKNNL